MTSTDSSDVPMTITPNDLTDVTYPLGDKPISEWSDDQVMKAYVDAFRAVNVYETYSSSDLKLERQASAELQERGIIVAETTSITFYPDGDDDV